MAWSGSYPTLLGHYDHLGDQNRIRQSEQAKHSSSSISTAPMYLSSLLFDVKSVTFVPIKPKPSAPAFAFCNLTYKNIFKTLEPLR